ncbi:MAG TPA: apolipoprotein N-acyltransferase [Pirellulales bacterium]|nr:apolipoprotein N-acyltransferase [Pirellulales bacterium]
MATSLSAQTARKRAEPAAQPARARQPQDLAGLRRGGTWLPAFAGSLLLYAAFPPLDWWPLSWVAPVFWLAIVRPRELPGRSGYVALWAAGFTYWFLVLHWLRLPHPTTIIGWFALSMYLAIYLPAFVAISRVAVHRVRMPLIMAAPIVWAGLELAQAHFLTGFNMAALAHSQWRWLPLIQIAELAGSYAVSALVIFVAACLASCLPLDGHGWRRWPLLPAAAAVIGALVYGYVRLDHPPGKPGPTIALIQGSIDTELKHDPVKQRQIYPHYLGLSERAVKESPKLDLIVWPETMYRDKLLSCTDDAVLPATWQTTLEQIRDEVPWREELVGRLARELDKPLLLGIDYLQLGPNGLNYFNSALFVSREGALGPRYDKRHPVPFGEFMPLARRFAWLEEISPIGAGIDWGKDVPVFDVAGTKLAANICYESAMPHVVRDEVVELREKGEEPDILVNLTNDGWFRGSSELDLHLTCAVFRAVECRKPFLIAANTGFSAWIDSDGRIVKQGPRRQADVLIAQPLLDGRHSLYLAWGDWPAGLCLAAVGCLALVGLRAGLKGG